MMVYRKRLNAAAEGCRWHVCPPWFNKAKGGYYVLHAHDGEAKYIEVYVKGDGMNDAIQAIEKALKEIKI